MKKIIASVLGIILLGALILGIIFYKSPLTQIVNASENIAPQGVAHLVFSGKIDHDAVLENLKVFHPEKEIVGTFQWKDEFTLKYTPENLQDIKSYSMIFEKPIKDSLGRTLDFPQKLNFFVSEGKASLALQTPEDKANELEGNFPITLLWSEPVFVLDNPVASAQRLKDSITITPAIEGSWQQLGASGLLFEPTNPWKYSTKYEIEIRPPVLGEALKFSFSTKVAQPSIIADNLIAQAPLKLAFNQPINLEAFPKINFNPSFEYDLSYPKEKKTEEDGKEIEFLNKNIVQITPRTPWEENQEYKIQIPAGGYALEGPLPATEYSSSFYTISPFAVNSSDQCQPEKGVQEVFSIAFSSNVGIQEFLKNLEITPALSPEALEAYQKEMLDQMGPDYQSPWYTVNPIESSDSEEGRFWKTETEYTIKIKPTLKDIYGRELKKEKSCSFKAVFPNFIQAAFLPQYGTSISKEAIFKPSFVYSGDVTLEASLELIDSEKATLASKPKTIKLPESPNKKSIHELDLPSLFPENFEDGKWKSGRYNLNFKGILASQEKNPYPYHPQFNTNFLVSDFLIVLKTEGTSTLGEISLMDEAGEALKGIKADIIFFESNGGYLQETFKPSGSEKIEDFPKKINIPSNFNFLILTLEDGRIGVLNQGANSSFSPYEAHIIYSPWEYQQRYKAVSFLDRPLFKPGETVYLKSILREKNLVGKLPGLKEADNTEIPYTVQVMDPFWKEIIKKEDVSKGGSFDTSFELPLDAPLGQYQIQIDLQKDGNPDLYSFFSIEKFRVPRILTSASFDKTRVVFGETVNAKITGNYGFGGALKGKKVSYKATLGGSEDCLGKWWGCPFREKVLATGEGIMDQEGVFNLPLRVAPESTFEGKKVDWSTLTLFATIIESPAESFSETLTLPYFASSRVIQLSFDDGYWNTYKPESKKVFEGSIQDLDYNPLKASTEVQTKLFAQKWVRNDRKEGDGTYMGDWQMVKELVQELTTKTDETGVFKVEITLPKTPGQYTTLFETKDEAGRIASREQGFRISGKEDPSITQNSEKKIVELVADKTEYKAGETAEILFPLKDFTITYARATLERGQVLQELEVDLEKNTIKLPIEDWMTPNVFVTLFLQGKDGKGENNIRWGSVDIPVKNKEGNLSLEITPDQKEYRPGDTVKLDIMAKNEEGPQEAEVTLAVVDESLLALKSREPLDLWSIFLSELPLGVTTTSNLDISLSLGALEAINQKLDAVSERMALAGGGGGGYDKGGAARPRGDFRNTATFLPKIMTDKDGKATVEFKLPDNLTTWNIWAIGHTTKNSFGQQELKVISTLPLLISEVVPNFFQLGDKVSVGLMLRRSAKEPVSEKVKVSIEVPAWMKTEVSEKEIDLKESEFIFFPLELPITPELLKGDITETSIKFSVQSNGETLDSIVLKRPLTLPKMTVSAAESLRVSEATSFKILRDARSLFSKSSLEVYASVASRLEKIKQQVLWADFGGIESSFNTVTAQFLDYDLAKTLGKELPKLDDVAIKKTQERIKSSLINGGYPFWEGNDRPDPRTTAQIVQYAPLWERFGYPLEGEDLITALAFLSREMQKECTKDSWDCLDEITRQRAGFILAQNKKLPPADLLFLSRKEYTESREAQIYWLFSEKTLKDQNQELPPTLETVSEKFWKNIKNSVSLRDRIAFWETSEGFYGIQNEAMTALVYKLSEGKEDFEALRPKMARYLSESGSGYLASDTLIHILEALGTLAKQEVSMSASADYLIQTQKSGEKAVPIAEGNLENPLSQKTFEKIIAPEDLSLTDLQFIPKNGKYYYADVLLQEVLPAELVKSLEKGFIVKREYFSVTDEKMKTPLTELKAGENYKVRLQVINHITQRDVLLEDFIPSGAEIINFALEGQDQTLNPQPPMNPWESIWRCWGWCGTPITHQEFHENKAQFFFERLYAGTHQITYLLKARIPGTFDLSPAHIRVTNFPEIFGTSDGMRMEIKE